MGTLTQLKDIGLFHSQGLIGGQWSDAQDGRTLSVNNPATGELLTNVPFMGGVETRHAIAAASEAFPAWSRRTAADRSKLLRKWFDLLLTHKDDLGRIMTLEQGKPLAEAIGEVTYGAGFVELYAEEAKRVCGDIIPSPYLEKRIFVLKQVRVHTKGYTTITFSCLIKISF
jgi:succinate-semialdehyde dehydrogenase